MDQWTASEIIDEITSWRGLVKELDKQIPIGLEGVTLYLYQAEGAPFSAVVFTGKGDRFDLSGARSATDIMRAVNGEEDPPKEGFDPRYLVSPNWERRIRAAALNLLP